ncbi:8865_t:CDS:2, partial [Diversispora eburnea]
LGLVHLGASSKIWIKYGDGQPVKIVFNGEDVDDLKETIKKKLSSKLGDIDIDDIILRRHEDNDDLDPGFVVDKSFENTSNTPLQVIVNAPLTSKRKYEESGDLKEIVKSGMKEFSQQNQPIECDPFLWDMETDEDRQMSEVEK